MSLRDEVEALGPPPRASMFIRAWNNRPAFARMMTGDEKDKLDTETLKRRKRKKDPVSVRFRERLLIACMEDEHGAPMFKPTDEDWLANQFESALTQMFTVACKHNGLIEPEEEADSSP